MTDTSAPAQAARPRISLHVLGPVLALIALIILGASLNGNFLSYGNVTNVLARSAFIGIIADRLISAGARNARTRLGLGGDAR